MIRAAQSLLAVGLLASLAAAQQPTVSGRVVSATGAPVAGVNIDAFDSTGDEINLSNDGTNANGDFLLTVDEGPGVYTLVFYPPAPPLSTHLVGEVQNVVVVTTANVGTITLGAGVLLSGRAVRTGSIPVSNVTLTVIDGPTGQPITQVQTKTNAFGQFNLAVPAHPIELQLDATSSAFVLGSRSLERSPTGALALGDVQLPPGALVFGHVQRSNGTAVNGADLDFVKLAGGNSVFVPDDNTDAGGNFAVVVPVGLYDVEFCPRTADALASKRLMSVNITGQTTLPTVVLDPGQQLFGTVLDAHGQPAQGVDVDVFLSSTGAPVPLCNDDTSAGGTYSVFVPAGTYDVVFTRNGAANEIGGDLHQNVVVAGATQLDGMLDPLGHGNSGEPTSSGGTRQPLVHGPATAPAPAPIGLTLTDAGDTLELVGAEPGTRAWLWTGASPAELRHVGGAHALGFLAGAGRLPLPPREARFYRLGLWRPHGGWSLEPIGVLTR